MLDLDVIAIILSAYYRLYYKRVYMLMMPHVHHRYKSAAKSTLSVAATITLGVCRRKMYMH